MWVPNMQVTCVNYILHHLLLLSDILTLSNSSEDEEEGEVDTSWRSVRPSCKTQHISIMNWALFQHNNMGIVAVTWKNSGVEQTEYSNDSVCTIVNMHEVTRQILAQNR